MSYEHMGNGEMPTNEKKKEKELEEEPELSEENQIRGMEPFEGIFGKTSELTILEHFLSLPDEPLTIRDLEYQLCLTRPTIQKVLEKFVEWNIILVDEKVSPRLHYLNMMERVVQAFDLVNYGIGEQIEQKEFGEILEVSWFDIGIEKIREINNQERPRIIADATTWVGGTVGYRGGTVTFTGATAIFGTALVTMRATYDSNISLTPVNIEKKDKTQEEKDMIQDHLESSVMA